MTTQETKVRRLLELAIEDGDEELAAILRKKLPKTQEQKQEIAQANHEAESFALVLMGSMEDFIRKNCVGCGKPFLSSYARVTTCSEKCLKEVIESYGFNWDPERSMEDRFRPLRWYPRPEQLVKLKGESQGDFQGRQENYRRRLQIGKPIAMVVPAQAVELLDKMPEVYAREQLLEPEE